VDVRSTTRYRLFHLGTRNDVGEADTPEEAAALAEKLGPGVVILSDHVYPVSPPGGMPSVLDEASDIVQGVRQEAYGHPRDNHACTAALWNAYLERRGANLYSQDGEDDHLYLDAFDVCMLNVLQKVSRLAHTRQRDGLVDIAGFAANAEMVDDG